MRGAYYNEINPEKAAVIRELIKANVVAPGDVDERSIADVSADDVRGYAQCHWFAGFAVWSYALRLAGWPDDREVWTGSCPCPSFSSAGKGQGFDDARHLWPDWFRLIRECRPATVFGEQADDAIGFGWLDLVQAQMEAENYALGKVVLASASVGGADLRERLYFVAHSTSTRRHQRRSGRESHDYPAAERSRSQHKPERLREASELGKPNGSGSQPRRETGQAMGHRDSIDATGGFGELGHTSSQGLPQRERNRRVQQETMEPCQGQAIERGSYLGGFWANAEWIWCRDNKYRPVEPGTFPLAHGAPARVLRLRGYGDAINAQVAKAFIEAYTSRDRGED